MSIELQKFQGGGGTMTKAAAVGVIGVGGALVGLAVDKQAAIFAYLTAFTYWAGLAFGSLIALMVFHTFRAKWMVVVRRPLEAMAATVPFFLLLAIPVLLNLKDLYAWVDPAAAGLPEHDVHLIHAKHAYLNVGGFIARTFVYFAVGGFIAWRLFGLSVRQDTSGDPALTQKQRNLGIAGLPFIALVVTFASFDWMMSLNPTWFSTIFGVYYFAGSFWSTMAVLIIVTALAKGKDQHGQFVSAEHLHNLGKLLFAFTCFWAYIAFSQLLLIWISNLPEEVTFYTVRFTPGWAPVGIALIVGHFVVPFALLLSRDLKRTPGRLSLVAGWALLMNLVDIYWLIMPTANPEKPTFSIWLPLAWLGMGGLAVAIGIWKMRGHYAVPVKDPFLDVSLRYRQPT